MMEMIDLRSDTVTRPTIDMRTAMMDADVGDDVYKEDPSVNRLEAMTADMMGKEAALFCPSGTQSNLLALLAHCQRGDEYIVGQNAHTYRYEGGGAAVLGSIQPQPLDFEPDGTLDLEKVKALIKPDNFHYARTRLLCLENTQAGKVLPLEYLEQAARFAGSRHLGIHLDGARIFNAAVKLKTDVTQISQYADTVSCCLSKGLGAPVGSVLAGPENMIDSARRWRKMLGGGMRQAGILAAAGIHALTHHVHRLEQDHANAAALEQGLTDIPAVSMDPAGVQTNMLHARIDADLDDLSRYMKETGILISPGRPVRMVTHLDIDRQDIDTVINAFKRYFKKTAS